MYIVDALAKISEFFIRLDCEFSELSGIMRKKEYFHVTFAKGDLVFCSVMSVEGYSEL